jgi:hypothetical protein
VPLWFQQYQGGLAKTAAPGMCNPDHQTPVVDEQPTEEAVQRDTRSPAQRNHDGLKCGMRNMALLPLRTASRTRQGSFKHCPRSSCGQPTLGRHGLREKARYDRRHHQGLTCTAHNAK